MTHIKHLSFLIVMVSLMSLAAIGQSNAFGYAMDKYQPRNVAIPAPKLAVSDLKGNSLSPQQQGKPQFIVFWATYCPPCLKEMPSLNQLAQEKKEWQILPVSIDLGHAAKRIEAFYQKAQLTNLPILWDPKSVSMRTYQIRALPSTAVINHHGEWIGTVTGEIDWADPRNIRFFERLFAQN